MFAVFVSSSHIFDITKIWWIVNQNKVTREDFLNAIQEVIPAFGAATEEVIPLLMLMISVMAFYSLWGEVSH